MSVLMSSISLQQESTESGYAYCTYSADLRYLDTNNNGAPLLRADKRGRGETGPKSFRLQTELLVPSRAQRVRLHRGGAYELRGQSTAQGLAVLPPAGVLLALKREPETDFGVVY